MNISIQITLMFSHNSRNAPVCAPHNMINKIGVTHSAKLNESSEKYKLRRNWGRRRRRAGGRALPPVPLSALAIAHYDSGTVGYSNGTLTGARCDSRLFVAFCAFREDLHTISKETLRSLFTV